MNALYDFAESVQGYQDKTTILVLQYVLGISDEYTDFVENLLGNLLENVVQDFEREVRLYKEFLRGMKWLREVIDALYSNDFDVGVFGEIIDGIYSEIGGENGNKDSGNNDSGNSNGSVTSMIPPPPPLFSTIGVEILSSLAQTTEISTQKYSAITPITDQPFATSEFIKNTSEFETTSEILDGTEVVATDSSTNKEQGE